MLARLGPETVDPEMGGQDIASHVPAADGDADTVDVSTEVSRQVDKDLWFPRAHLQA